MRLFLVIYTDPEGQYAVAFTSFVDADEFARIFDGVVVDTTVDSHVDCCCGDS
jgi:hypothetical protein